MADRGIVDTIRQAHAAGLSLELTHGQLRLLLVELDVRASYAQHQSQAITRLEQQLAEHDKESITPEGNTGQTAGTVRAEAESMQPSSGVVEPTREEKAESVSERCHRTGYQVCNGCDDTGCGDNMARLDDEAGR